MTFRHQVQTRFLEWQDLGALTFTPDDTDRVVGSFSLNDGDNTIWIRVESETPPTPWPWSFGILGWRSSRGYELGTCKAYSDESGLVYRLGVGLSPVERTGVITFEPRGFNLAWIKKGNPWTLKFEAVSGNPSGGGGGDGSPSYGSASNSLVSTSGLGIPYIASGETAILNFQ